MSLIILYLDGKKKKLTTCPFLWLSFVFRNGILFFNSSSTFNSPNEITKVLTSTDF